MSGASFLRLSAIAIVLTMLGCGQAPTGPALTFSRPVAGFSIDKSDDASRPTTRQFAMLGEPSLHRCRSVDFVPLHTETTGWLSARLMVLRGDEASAQTWLNRSSMLQEGAAGRLTNRDVMRTLVRGLSEGLAKMSTPGRGPGRFSIDWFAVPSDCRFDESQTLSTSPLTINFMLPLEAPHRAQAALEGTLWRLFVEIGAHEAVHAIQLSGALSGQEDFPVETRRGFHGNLRIEAAAVQIERCLSYSLLPLTQYAPRIPVAAVKHGDANAYDRFSDDVYQLAEDWITVVQPLGRGWTEANLVRFFGACSAVMDGGLSPDGKGSIDEAQRQRGEAALRAIRAATPGLYSMAR